MLEALVPEAGATPEASLKRPAPEWVTFDRDATRWDDILKEHGVDSTARQELFCLAQFSEHGYREANSIMAKLLKKAADGERLGNISGFVHRCVLNARDNMHWSEPGMLSTSKAARHFYRGRWPR